MASLMVYFSNQISQIEQNENGQSQPGLPGVPVDIRNVLRSKAYLELLLIPCCELCYSQSPVSSVNTNQQAARKPAALHLTWDWPCINRDEPLASPRHQPLPGKNPQLAINRKTPCLASYSWLHHGENLKRSLMVLIMKACSVVASRKLQSALLIKLSSENQQCYYFLYVNLSSQKVFKLFFFCLQLFTILRKLS